MCVYFYGIELSVYIQTHEYVCAEGKVIIHLVLVAATARNDIVLTTGVRSSAASRALGEGRGGGLGLFAGFNVKRRWE